ncbi:MAG TPA: inositol monophosphatase family protein [Longimicrobiales bacterium]|nr:inositol monophosphatase family protein [Longimicrobiales bacterium]
MLRVALEAAREGARVHEQYLGRVSMEQWSEKGSADFVTHVDREAEARILETIRRHYPDHSVMAEESATEPVAAEWLWVVDPLDGTTNFLHQYPMYCASVALLHDGAPVAGAVVSNPTGEEWAAAKGGGAFRNGQRIHISENDRIERALIGTGFPFKMAHAIESYLQQFHRVISNVSDIRRGGSAALDLCHVASGFLDGFWELDLRPWDYAAGVLMIQEAGGIVNGLFDVGTRISEPDFISGGGLLAGNAYVYEKLHDIVVKGRR